MTKLMAKLIGHGSDKADGEAVDFVEIDQSSNIRSMIAFVVKKYDQ